MSNRFFETFGKPVDPSSTAGKKTTDNMMRDGIQTQKDILNGKKPLTAKGTEKKSWFNENKKLFTPKFGTNLLFGKKGAVKYEKGQEMEMLELLEDMLDKGELEDYLKQYKEERGL